MKNISTNKVNIIEINKLLSQVVKIVGVLCNLKTKIKTTDMKMYYVNSFPDVHGDYKVHEEGCTKLAGFLSREFLNLSTSPEAAIKKAQKLHPSTKPCSCWVKRSFVFRKIINGTFALNAFVMVVLVYLIFGVLILVFAYYRVLLCILCSYGFKTFLFSYFWNFLPLVLWKSTCWDSFCPGLL